jgi:hypothetical protein
MFDMARGKGKKGPLEGLVNYLGWSLSTRGATRMLLAVSVVLILVAVMPLWIRRAWVQIVSELVGEESISESLASLVGTGVLMSAGVGLMLMVIGARIITKARAKSTAERASLETKTIEEKVASVQAAMRDTVSGASDQLVDVANLLERQASNMRTVLDELEEEFRARIDTLNALAREAEEAEARADQARALADISEPSRAAVDALIDSRLAQRFRGERKSQIITGIVFLILGALLSIPIGIWLASFPG